MGWTLVDRSREFIERGKGGGRMCGRGRITIQTFHALHFGWEENGVVQSGVRTVVVVVVVVV